MNFTENEEFGLGQLKILSFLKEENTDSLEFFSPMDPMETHLQNIPVSSFNREVQRVVSEGQFPEQSLYILQDQLQGIKSKLKRLRFYLDELEDILPH